MNASILAVAIRAMNNTEREAEAYDHASHGCPFFDTDTECPICDAENVLASYREAQGQADGFEEWAA